MTLQIDPVRFKALLVDAGVELPLAEARRDEVLAAFDVALERLFVIYDERQAQSRVELAIANASRGGQSPSRSRLHEEPCHRLCRRA